MIDVSKLVAIDVAKFRLGSLQPVKIQLTPQVLPNHQLGSCGQDYADSLFQLKTVAIFLLQQTAKTKKQLSHNTITA